MVINALSKRWRTRDCRSYPRSLLTYTRLLRSSDTELSYRFESSARRRRPVPFAFQALSAWSRQRSSRQMFRTADEASLEYDANTDSAAPSYAALLSYIAIKKFKPIRQRHHWEQLKARAAWGIIDKRTEDRGRFRRRNYLCLARHLTCWSDSLV
jgi:hypothetical protein